MKGGKHDNDDKILKLHIHINSSLQKGDFKVYLVISESKRFVVFTTLSAEHVASTTIPCIL